MWRLTNPSITTTLNTIRRNVYPSLSKHAHTMSCPIHNCMALAAPAAAAAAVPFTVPQRSFATEAATNNIIYTQKIPKKKSSFRDRVRIHVSGGRGGSGCSSYDTDPYGRGGPDGANGGRGGDVYLVSTSQLGVFSMETFHLKGQNGHAGGSSLAKGRNGYSLKVPIPSGTIVSEILDTNPEDGEYTLKFLADLDREGLEIKVATGGEGGLGNRAFMTQYRKQARFSTIGRAGTARWLHLELKCIADVGLVGYPNAGKSSFLDAISNAAPEIANYPFTTLHPQVGVVELSEFVEKQTDGQPSAVGASVDDSTSTSPPLDRITVADLPGLISGAARENRGLGHEFLKHIQRTKVLCYVLDLSGNDDRCPVEDFQQLQQELQDFDPTILLKPAMIIANKIDNTSKNKKSWMNNKLDILTSITSLPIFPSSMLQTIGLKKIVTHLGKMLRKQLEMQEKERLAQMKQHRQFEKVIQQEKEEEEKRIKQQQHNQQKQIKLEEETAAVREEQEQEEQEEFEEEEEHEQDDDQRKKKEKKTKRPASSKKKKSTPNKRR